MTGRGSILAGALVLVAAALTQLPGSPAGAAQAAEPKHGTAVQVNATEFSFLTSRRKLSPGIVRVELNNRGEDPHDLVLRSPTRRKVYRWELTGPGQAVPKFVRLRPARWNLTCTLPGHRELGMRAKVRVRRR